jgi:transcription antitermination protein NusB
MLSRRNIRVKVMQTLYSIDVLNQESKAGDAVNLLKKNLQQSAALFTYMVKFITEVARYSEKDAHQKASKHLPTEKDLSINTKIAGNDLVWQILENETFKNAVRDYKLENLEDDNQVKKVYQQLVQHPAYHEYIETAAREKKAERKILEVIFEDLMLADEDFTTELEEHFVNWSDDAEMLIALLNSFLQKPSGFKFDEIIGDEKWQFAKQLLESVIDKKEYTLSLIKPKLKNWDAERIAALDMLLMQMGICEFLFFETIPPRVTINEYIDLAKDYSTDQSGQFVNGILDNIHKELLQQNKIHKKNYKNSTL